jgi:hypothetical protein
MNFQLPDFIKDNAWHMVSAAIMAVSAGVGGIYATGLKEGMAITKQEAVAIRESQAKVGQEISGVKDDVTTVKQDVAEMKGKLHIIVEMLKGRK